MCLMPRFTLASTTMRIAAVVLSAVLAAPAWADEALWQELAKGRDLVVLMRHTEPSGGDPLAWDESGRCAGESMLTSAGKDHAKRIGDAFSRRAIKLVVFVSHRPNIDRLTMELIESGELLVGRVSQMG